MFTVSVPTRLQRRLNGKLRFVSELSACLSLLLISLDALQQELPYPLLSDPKRVLISALGAGTDKSTKRSHFIFEKGGKLVDKKVPVKPKDRFVSSVSSTFNELCLTSSIVLLWP